MEPSDKHRLFHEDDRQYRADFKINHRMASGERTGRRGVRAGSQAPAAVEPADADLEAGVALRGHLTRPAVLFY